MDELIAYYKEAIRRLMEYYEHKDNKLPDDLNLFMAQWRAYKRGTYLPLKERSTQFLAIPRPLLVPLESQITDMTYYGARMRHLQEVFDEEFDVELY